MSTRAQRGGAARVTAIRPGRLFVALAARGRHRWACRMRALSGRVGSKRHVCASLVTSKQVRG